MKTLILILSLFFLCHSTPSIVKDSMSFQDWDEGMQKFNKVYCYIQYTGKTYTNFSFTLHAISPNKIKWPDVLLESTTAIFRYSLPIVTFRSYLTLPWYSNKTDTIRLRVVLIDGTNYPVPDTLIDTLKHYVPLNLTTPVSAERTLPKVNSSSPVLFYDISGRIVNVNSAPKGRYIRSIGKRAKIFIK